MANAKIKAVRARQIIDCKCRPMVEVDVVTDDGYIGTGAAPTGSSVGMYESCVLRDGDPNEYNGMSVHKAVDNVNNIIAPRLIGMDVTDQAAIDAHHASPMMATIAALREKYDLHMTVERFVSIEDNAGDERFIRK